jgi:hypothetical protein
MKQLAVRMREADMVMTLKDEKPWHMLFYRLREEYKSEDATFLQSMQFDWDGPYPKSQDVSDFLQGLHWTGSVSALNPTYERIIIPDEVQRVWKAEGEHLGEDDKALLTRGLEIAQIEFSSLIAA